MPPTVAQLVMNDEISTVPTDFEREKWRTELERRCDDRGNGQHCGQLHFQSDSQVAAQIIAIAEILRAHAIADLEGIIAKRLADPYGPYVRWFKIKIPDYSQKEGRGDFFNRPRPGR